MLKKHIKLGILKIFEYLAKFSSKISGKTFQKRTFSINNFHLFFGYYDLNPFNLSETKLLAIKTESDFPATRVENAEIGYFNLTDQNSKFVELGSSKTWNWQQGCRLRWFENNKSVIYNDLFNEGYGAVIREIDTKKVLKLINFPLYDISANKKIGLSLNFSRLQRLRPGYGYDLLPDTTINQNAPNGDGIFLIDLENNKSELCYSIEELSKISPDYTMIGAQHYINHLSFNPTGSHFLFFHLWCGEQRKRYSRLFVSDINGSALKLMRNYGSISHYTWLNDDKFIITANVDANSIRYLQYDKEIGFEKIIGNKYLLTDGHPTFISDSQKIITDTYPNLFQIQKLITYDIQSIYIEVIDYVFLPTNFSGEFRCDLHPRVSESGNKICIDFVKNGYRSMKVISKPNN